MGFLDKLIRSGYWRGLNQPPDLGSLTRYVVRDIPCGTPNGAGVILLLESPNTIEVSRGYPLAGRSGADVTSVLGPIAGIPESPDDRAFGAVLRAATLDDRMKGFGVMNVSQLPVQSAAYPYPVRRAFDAILFNKFKTLRHIGAVKRANRSGTRQIKELLIEDLRDRIRLTRTGAYFIPCGRVADAFFEQANTTHPRRRTDLTVPHPSRGQWRHGGNEKVLRRLRNEIRKELP